MNILVVRKCLFLCVRVGCVWVMLWRCIACVLSSLFEGVSSVGVAARGGPLKLLYCLCALRTSVTRQAAAEHETRVFPSHVFNCANHCLCCVLLVILTYIFFLFFLGGLDRRGHHVRCVERTASKTQCADLWLWHSCAVCHSFSGHCCCRRYAPKCTRTDAFTRTHIAVKITPMYVSARLS